MAFELGAVVGTAALEWVAGKLLDGAQAKLGPDADLSRAIGEALDQADQAVPELFASCHRDGMQGLDSFLKGFLAHSAVLQELQKPVTGKGAPDAEILEEVFRQALAALEEPQRVTKENLLPGVRFKEADKLQLDRLMPWMKAFAEGYFQRMPDGVRFWVARADYCEQLRNRFDVVRFGGIDVAIDRAEKLADIFVMPDVREETNRRSFAEANATWAPMETELDEVTGKTRIIHPELRNFDETSFTTQQLLLLEQQKESNWRRNQEKGQIVSEKELLKQNRRAVLLGAPGSGKTTLMSYWAVATCAAEAEAAVSDLPDNCLPILIRIRDLARQPEMGVLEFAQDFAQRELSAKALPQGFFEYWLDNGQALILLDGLDEVADTAQRYKVVTKIEAFLGQFAENAAIITSRPSGYKRDFFRTEEYPHYELQPFNDQQIDQFIDCWYERRYELERDRQQAKEGLRKALAAQPRIKQLARNPLLLTMIGLIHLSRARLPQKRYELYDLAVKTLLLNWDEHKQIRDKKLFKYLDDTDDLRRLMEQLAYWIHSQGGTGDEEGGTLIDREELLTQLSSFIEEMKGVKRHQAKEEAKRFLDKVVRDRAGLLAQQGQDRYAFVHKTFQEYLTAMELYERKSDGIDEVLAEIELHLHDSHWEEVLLLLIAQLRKKEFSRSLQVIWNYQEPYQNWLHRNLFFVGLCLAENLPLTRDGLDQTAIAKLIELEVNSSPLVTSKLKQKVFKSLNGLAETPLAREVMKQLEANEAISSERLLDYRQKLQPEQAVIELLTLLKDDDSKVRYRAAESLGELGNASESVVEGLLALLKDDDSKVRYRAAESLGELGNASESVVEGLLALLKDDSWNVRYLAASSLGKLGNASESVVEGLLALLKYDSWNVRDRAAESLGELGNASESVVEGLLALLKDDSWNVRDRAAESLGKLGNASESVVEGLLALLKDDSWNVRDRAAESLGELGNASESVVEGLLALLKDDDWNVRDRAAESLGELGNASESVVEGLLALLKDDDSDVRYRAAESLIKLGNASESVVEGLLALLKDDSWNVRYRAAESLSKLGNASESVVEGLLALLKDDDRNVRYRAAESLVKLGNASESVVEALLALLKDDDRNVRYRAAESLGELGNASESVVEGLLALLKDDDWNVRDRAAESLGELGNASESVVEALLALLKDDDRNVRDRAAESLGELGNASESVVEALLALLKDDDSKVRYLAASSLGELDNASESVVEALLALLKDDDSKVRYLAASSLVKLDNTSESVVEGLLELLKDETNFVAKNRIGRINNYAATSLTQLGKKSDKVLPALIQWIEQNENQPYVGNGIDVLSELVN